MFYEKTPDGYLLRLKISPNASKCASTGIYRDASGTIFLKIAINAVPEKGKANQALIKFLSKALHQNKQSFSIISGETAHCKKILLTAEASEKIEQALVRLGESS